CRCPAAGCPARRLEFAYCALRARGYECGPGSGRCATRGASASSRKEMKILNVVGARPNFVKIAPLMREMGHHPSVSPILVHTGQHYTGPMSEQFFEDLEIPAPDFNLGVGSGSHAVQTAEVMRRLEPILEATHPDLVLVVGDVNSTLAAA